MQILLLPHIRKSNALVWKTHFVKPLLITVFSILLALLSVSKSNAQTCKDIFPSAVTEMNVDLPDFETRSSSNDQEIDEDKRRTLPQGVYGDIEVKEDARLTISQNNQTTYINELKAKKDTKIYLDDGIYWIETLKLDKDAEIIIRGTGKVVLFVKESDFDDDLEINVDGDPEQFVLVLYKDSKFKEDTKLKGFIYGDKDIRIEDDSEFEGAVTGDDIRLEDDVSVDYKDENIDSIEIPGLCSFTPSPVEEFTIYLSTDDSSAGDKFAEGDDWETSYDIGDELEAGKDYYLHVAATNTGAPAAFIGDFVINTDTHVFSNGETTLSTNTSDWQVSNSGWDDYESVTDYGENGDDPWDTRDNIDESARWIWSDDNEDDDNVYFTTKISAVDPADPVDQCSAPGTMDTVGIRIRSNGNGKGYDREINSTTEAIEILEIWQDNGSKKSGNISNNDTRYNVASAGTGTTDRLDFGGKNKDYSGTVTYPGIGPDDGERYSDFLVAASGTLSLPAGDYTFYVQSDDGFSLRLTTISGDTVNFAKNSSEGDSNELRHERPTGNSRRLGSFTLSQASVFQVDSIFWERGGGDYMEVSVINSIETRYNKNSYEILKDGALNGQVAFGCGQSTPPPPSVNHYQIIHDAQGLTCEPETLTIKACSNSYNGTCTLSDEPVSLNLIVSGSTTVNQSTSFTGSTSVQFSYTEAENVSLSINQTSITPDNSTVCIANGSTTCSMLFEDAGFRFIDDSGASVIQNQVSGTPFPIKIQAVKNNNGVCEGMLSGTQSIQLAQQNIEPDNTGGLPFVVNSQNLSKYPDYSAVSLSFDANSIATLTNARYDDAGEIRLYAKYQNGNIDIAGSSNAFWVSPYSLDISATYNNMDLNGSSATSSTKHPAGEPFNFVVEAKNANGATTQNYQPGQLQLKLTKQLPSQVGTVMGDLQISAGTQISSSISPSFNDVSLTTFNSGVSTFSNAHYSEVGIISLDLKDENYGNQGIRIDASEITIGRFTPHHFEQTVASKGLFYAQCDMRIAFFAYSGQLDENNAAKGAIAYLDMPVLEISAYNKQGLLTKNYYQDTEGSANDFMHLSASNILITPPSADEFALGTDNANLPVVSNIMTGTLSQNDLVQNTNTPLPRGTLHYQLSQNDNFYYTRSQNSKVAPFDASLPFAVNSIVDSDTVTASSTEGFTPTGLEIRFGRAVLENSFGPEINDLAQTIKYEHFDGDYFTLSTDNDCTGFDENALSLISMSLDKALTGIESTMNHATSGRILGLKLNSPGSGHQGEIGLELDVHSWLKYDWSNDGALDENPSAVAVFGIFRNDDRLLNRRELLQN